MYKAGNGWPTWAKSSVSPLPILACKCDYGCPFTIKEYKWRNICTVKVYLALIVCISVNSVSLKLESDLAINAFLAVLNQFSPVVEYLHTCILIATWILWVLLIGLKYFLTRLKRKIRLHLMFRVPGILTRLLLYTSAVFGRPLSKVQSITWSVSLAFGSDVWRIVNVRLPNRRLPESSLDPHNLCASIPGDFLIG